MIGPVNVGGLTFTSKMPGDSYSLQAKVTCNVGAKLALVPDTPCFDCYADRGAYAWRTTREAQARRFSLLTRAIEKDGAAAWSLEFGEWLSTREAKTRARLEKIGAPDKETIAAFYTLQASGSRCTAGAKRILAGSKACEKMNCIMLAKTHLASLSAWENTAILERKRMKAFVSHDRAAHFRWLDSGDIFSDAFMVAIVAVASASPNVKHWLPTQERTVIKNQLSKGPLPENLNVRISSAKVDAHTIQKMEGVNASSVSSDGKSTGSICQAYTRGGICGDCRLCWEPTVALITYPIH